MGRLEKIFTAKKIALDTNIFIYALEDNKKFPLAAEFFRKLPQKTKVFTSILSVLEATVPLYQKDKKGRIPDYVNFIRGQGLIKIVPVDQAVALKAAELRALYKLKTPDSIHLATAIVSEASLFLTADRDFKLNSIGKVKIEKI